MSKSVQPVEGASLLSSLAGLFFKGLDNVLDRAAEYQEEMGVLKQVNRIPIETLDGNNTYTLTIKLSPVRGKDSYYFVEAETDAPGLDVSKINEKTMNIDKANSKQFRDLVDKLISSSNYSAEMDKSEDEDDSEAEVVGEPAEGEEGKGSEGDVTAEGVVDEVIKAAKKWLDNEPVFTSLPGDQSSTPVLIKVDFKPADKSADIEVYATDVNEKRMDEFEPLDTNISIEVDNPSTEDAIENFKGEVEKKIREFGSEYNFDRIVHSRSNNVVSATFIKDKDGIGLTAVRASDDINKTMDIIYDLMDSDDFVNQIDEGQEASFQITEEDDDYDIESIEEVDTSNTYANIYQSVSQVYITLKSLEVMIGLKVWQNDSFFNALYLTVAEFQTTASTWLLDNCDILPILQDPYKLVPSFEAYRNYGDNSEIPAVKQSLSEDLNNLVIALDFMSVNLDEDRISKVVEFNNRIKQILSYI